MKKIFAIIAALFCVSGLLYSSEADELNDKKPDNRTITIIPQDQHQDGVKSAKVTMEYTPSTYEVHIYYECLAVSYDQGAAMDTIRECLKDFQLDNGFESYYYMRKDSVKYYNDEKKLKWAKYHSYVAFKPGTLNF